MTQVNLGAATIAAVLALAAAGCDRLDQRSASATVTVRLPPARTAAPGFEFDRKGPQR